MSYQPKNMLVTGGAGFIGCNFIRYIQKTDETVSIVNLDKLSYAGSLDNLRNLPSPERHEFIEGDICEATLVDFILRKYEIDTVVHFAAESHVDRSISGPTPFVQSNFVGTFTLLESARKFWLEEKSWNKVQCRFHHISTDEVYGALSKSDPAFTEKTPYAPNSPYSASKAGSDHMVRAYFHTYGLPVTTTNCSNNYGPFQHSEKFIPTIIQSCLKHELIPVYGDGSNIRDWLYVEDHCQAIDRVVREGELGETYNVGGDNEWSNIDIVKTICRRLDQKRPMESSYESLISFVKDRSGHDWRYAIDGRKILNQLGWQPELTFEKGIELTVEWYLSCYRESSS